MYFMGLLLQHVSSMVLVWVAILLRDSHSAEAAQTSDLFVDLSATCSRKDFMENLSLPTAGPSRCLHSAPIRFKENATGSIFSFSITFEVWLKLCAPDIDQIGDGASARNALEGFTFAMLPHPNASLSGDGGYLGLLNATSNGDPQSHTFAVEFDFVNSPQFSDPDVGFHIGIDVNSMNSTSWAFLQRLSATTDYPPMQVRIDYDASLQILNVSTAFIDAILNDSMEVIDGGGCPLSDIQLPVPSMISPSSNETSMVPHNFLSQKIDLSNVINEHMYVGFTSALSSLPEYYCGIIFGNWSLTTSNSTSPTPPSDPFPCSAYYQYSGQTFVQPHSFAVRLASVLVSLTAMAAIYAVLYKYYCAWVERRGWRFNIDADDLEAADPHKFTYRELALATKNFDPKQALGRGGFGSVYKGFLPGNQQDVAIKRVAPDSNQGEREFMAEVMIIGKIRHRNLVRLQGWCHERGELLLVYDYMPQGSLDKLLFGSQGELPSSRDEQGAGESVAVDRNVVVGFPWERRFKVIVDVATALVYLHTECEERIIHRDVKAANVMLDAKFNARLGDFGLARSYNHSLLSPESTNVAGTFGYLAPELFHTGKQTEHTDVYSFGAFLLEVVCGKKPIYHQDGEVVLLLDHVWHLWGNSQILDAADLRLAGMYNAHEMIQVLCLGLLCSHPNPAMRPCMRKVLLILNGDVLLPEVPLSKPRLDYFPSSSPPDLPWTTNPSSSPPDLSQTSNPSSMYYTASATTADSR